MTFIKRLMEIKEEQLKNEFDRIRYQVRVICILGEILKRSNARVRGVLLTLY